MARKAALVAGALVLGASPALAHHSAAMFDATKEVTLQGTVKEFQWTNPHTWVQLNVADGSGKVVEWSIEGGGPSALYRRGWRATSLKPGDKITVVVNPLRNGAPGGNMRSVTMADGRKLGES